MKVGFGRAVITPPVGTSLVGYFEDRRSVGIRDELYAVAAVFEDGRERFAVVGCDLCWVDARIVEAARKLIAESLPIPADHVLVHAGHTHTGPLPSRPEKSIYESPLYVEPAYVELLPHYIAGSVRAAWEKRQEARIGSAVTTAPGLAFNRRYYLKDGRVVTNPLNQRDQVVRPAGPVDESLGVVKVENRRGDVLGLLVNFGLHPDTLGDNLISADWPARLREHLYAAVPGAECLVLNGPSGDINHLNLKNLEIRGVEIGERIGASLARRVVALLPRMKTASAGCLRAGRVPLRVGYRAVTPQELREARVYVARKDVSRQSLRYLISLQLIELDKRRKRDHFVPTEVLGFCAGSGLAVLGLPGEVFTEIGLAIKRTAPFRQTFIVQNSSSALAYVPSAEAFRQHERNFTIRPGYGEHDLTEAIGIDCSYETTPLSCKVDVGAGVLLENASRTLLAGLARRCGSTRIGAKTAKG